MYPEVIVGALILNKKDEILLVRQDKWHGQYCIPGGHVELNETLENAIKREVKEEVGIDIDVLLLLGVQDSISSKYFHKKGKHFIFLDYLCRTNTDDVVLDMRECQEFLWIEPSLALSLNLHAGTRQNIKKFLELKLREVF